MPPKSFEVIVAGGGPAGATAAYSLASAGVNVAILDKATFPRDKSCGGGLIAKVLHDLPLDVKPVIRNAMNGMCFTYQFGGRFTKRHYEPVVYGTLRREFDNYLVEQAVRQGATLFDGTGVEGFEQNGEGAVNVLTRAGSLSCRVLIGADGANGVVRRALNNEQAFFNQAGLSFEIERERIIDDRVDGALMRVDWGTLPSGYAWIFPKGDFLNIGVGGPVAIGKRLKPYLHEFLVNERILRTDRVSLDDLNVSGHKLPTFTERTRLSDRNVLVIGDAAGLIEPLTGDGISYGVQSARLAADVVLHWLSGACRDLSEYDETVLREIVPEIVYTRKFLAFFNAFPTLVHQVVSRDDRVWQAFCRVLKGEEAFHLLRRKKMGRLYGVAQYVDRFAFYYEARRLKYPQASETLFQRLVGRMLERIGGLM
ncbi:MAG: geranylgeranyl reductase family protein [Candidatus Rokubacteria bacterium]|nr:geranylgeranyl reductase family protein [Candidatus Rokubacteria bacterium]